MVWLKKIISWVADWVNPPAMKVKVSATFPWVDPKDFPLEMDDAEIRAYFNFLGIIIPEELNGCSLQVSDLKSHPLALLAKELTGLRPRDNIHMAILLVMGYHSHKNGHWYFASNLSQWLYEMVTGQENEKTYRDETAEVLHSVTLPEAVKFLVCELGFSVYEKYDAIIKEK